MYDRGIISRGKYIFVSRFGYSTRPWTAFEIVVEKNIHGRRPEKTKTG
jgi:hypothetical protein